MSKPNKLILATGSDKGYLPHIQRYLDSMRLNSNFDINVLVLMGDQPELVDLGPGISLAFLNRDDIRALNVNKCVQHGEFLESKFFEKFEDSDIICFTDGDIYLQRAMNTFELDIIRNLKDGDVWVGYNDGPEDTLEAEFYRLSPTGLRHITDFEQLKCYNTGVVCANKKTWQDLKNRYIEQFSKVDEMFRHYAKQQWLISYILKDFNVVEMDYSTHSHNFYGVKPGMVVHEGVLYHNETPTLFRHKWF